MEIPLTGVKEAEVREVESCSAPANSSMSIKSEYNYFGYSIVLV